MAEHTHGRITAIRERLTPGESGNMSSPLSSITINTGRLNLTSREQAEAETLIARLHALKLKSTRRKVDEARGPFPFLRLPPELRLHCYAFLLDHHNSPARIDLTTLVIPSIARVCTRIRTEFLPWFFASTPFVVTVAADLRNHSLVRARLPYTAQPILHRSVRARSGVLHMRKQVKDLLQQMRLSRHFLLRDLVLRICDAERWRFPKDSVLPERCRMLEVALKVEQGELRVSDNRDNPWYAFPLNRARDGFDPGQEALVVVERARRVAEEIAARGGENVLFQGFGLLDVERIARVFRSSQ